jgi:RHS repeat-associated protein
MPLASTWMDLVVGVDVHIEMVPTPAPTPTPFPHPHCSVVFDPVGYIVGEVAGMLFSAACGQPIDPNGPILVGGRMATITGDSASMPVKHIIIPPGTVFAKGITDSDAELMVGSKTVLMRGGNAVRAGEVGLSCSEPVRLPTAMVVGTSGGPSITDIGGPPAIDFGAAAGLLAMKGVRNKWVSGKLHAAADKVIPKKWERFRRLTHKSVCFFTGHPVNVATGTVSTSAVDLELPGPIPLKFAREYDGNWCDRASPLGFGWSHSLDQRIWIERDTVVLLEADGRELEFATEGFADRVMRRGDEAWHPVDRLTLRALGELRWEVRGVDGLVRVFAPVAGESAADKDRGLARLVAIRSLDGHAIELTYDEQARLRRAVDTGGRVIELEHDAAGRLRRLWAPAPDGRGLRQHAEYRYSPEGDLVAVVDALGASWTFEYDGHLLVRERDRAGLSFFFAYDGHGRYARCIRTWGDGGIYDHVIAYDRRNLVTLVTNSLGETTKYEMNGLGMVAAIVQPDGTAQRREYDGHGWLVAEVDELEQATRYEHDARGNVVMTVAPDRAVTKTRYDAADRAVEHVDAAGATWQWAYDLHGRLVRRVDPLGHATTWVYEDRVLVAMVDAAGARTSFAWDRAGNLVEVTTADGAKSRREHDALGRVVAVHDAKGNVQRRGWDALGRLVRVDEPDGNVRRLERDPEGRVVRAVDRLRDVALEYEGMGWLAARTIGRTTVRYRHDTEGQLVAVVNERGLEHRFELDAVGRVRAEIAVDGVTTTFVRDAAGRPTKALRSDGKVVAFEHDAAGRRTKTGFADGTFAAFEYDPVGRVTRAANENAAVSFERDALGRVTAERCERTDTTHEDRRATVIERRWDHRGRRVGMRSSLGTESTIARNAMGDVTRVSAQHDGRRWEAAFERDVLGDEVNRSLPGGARSYWWRDALGRPTQHWIGRETKSFRTRRYRWDVDDRLLAIEEDGRGELAYAHDDRGALVSATWGDGGVDGRNPDDVGNLFASPQRDDREYGAAGEVRLVRTREGAVALEYDARGRLASKREPGGVVWRYHWNDADQLVQVDRPDGTAVAMSYDALGRRLSKNHLGKRTCFVWDADVPLHEWSEAAELVHRRRTKREEARASALLTTRDRLLARHPSDWASRWEAELANADGFEQLHAELRDPPQACESADAPLVTWLFEPGTFAPMARLSSEGAHAIVADHVGTPLVVLDERGTTRAQYVTDTYGRATTAGAAELCPFRFAGQYLDAETGLHYNRFRHYDPSTGEYTSRDPVGLRGGLHAYAYVDDPTTSSDPLGLSKTAGAGESCAGETEGGSPPRIVVHPSQRAAMRAAAREAGMGRHGRRHVKTEPLHAGSRAPTGPRGVRTEATSPETGRTMHHDPYGHAEPEIGPHYGVSGPGIDGTTHHVYPSTHAPATNR